MKNRASALEVFSAVSARRDRNGSASCRSEDSSGLSLGKESKLFSVHFVIACMKNIPVGQRVTKNKVLEKTTKSRSQAPIYNFPKILLSPACAWLCLCVRV